MWNYTHKKEHKWISVGIERDWDKDAFQMQHKMWALVETACQSNLQQASGWSAQQHCCLSFALYRNWTLRVNPGSWCLWSKQLTWQCLSCSLHLWQTLHPGPFLSSPPGWGQSPVNSGEKNTRQQDFLFNSNRNKQSKRQEWARTQTELHTGV